MLELFSCPPGASASCAVSRSGTRCDTLGIWNIKIGISATAHGQKTAARCARASAPTVISGGDNLRGEAGAGMYAKRDTK